MSVVEYETMWTGEYGPERGQAPASPFRRCRKVAGPWEPFGVSADKHICWRRPLMAAWPAFT